MLPRALTLPSGARVTLVAKPPAPAVGPKGSALFAEVLALDGDVTLAKDGAPLAFADLSLADFHVLRAVLTKSGYVAEDEVEVDCHNCGELLTLKPCARLEIAPWVDGELGDPELDVLPPLGGPVDIEPVRLGRVRHASTVTFGPRTAGQAAPLFAALAKDPFDFDEAVVRAMGITALGPATSPARIAEALATCEDAAFTSVTDAFLAAHYPLRLGADVFCPKCKARNTVDAPALREFDAGAVRGPSDDGRDDERPLPLPPLAEFVDLAHAIAEPLLAELPGEPVELVVEGGTPAVDDGGEPLLGSYLPPPPKDAAVPTRPPTVTIYYRTFESIEREDGRFDWEGELRETIEHELEHHVYFLRGDDPMDAEERAEIDREAARVVGSTELTRRGLAVFGQSVPDFFARAWPLVAIAAAVLAITLAQDRCGGNLD